MTRSSVAPLGIFFHGFPYRPSLLRRIPPCYAGHPEGLVIRETGAPLSPAGGRQTPRLRFRISRETKVSRNLMTDYPVWMFRSSGEKITTY